MHINRVPGFHGQVIELLDMYFAWVIPKQAVLRVPALRPAGAAGADSLLAGPGLAAVTRVLLASVRAGSSSV